MKNVITYLKTLWRRGLGSQSSDVSFDCRLTVGSPSVKYHLNLLRLVAISVLLLTIGSGNAWGETVIYAQTSTSAASVSSGTAPTGSSVSFSNTYSTKEQLTSGNNMVLTLTSLGGISISNITLSMKSNKSGGAGKLSYSTNGGSTWTYLVGGTSSAEQFDNAAWYGSYSTSYVNISKTVSLTNVTQLKIKIEATANSLYCQSFQLTYTAAASCAKKVTITKGTPETGGSFSLDKTGEQNCCDALVVTVSNIVAPSGKKFSAITQSGIASGVTINQSAKTVTYAANTTGSSTINVTYEAKGCEDKGASSITSTSGGNSYTYGPVDEYYKYSTRQILYSKSDLGLSSSTKKGTIKSIYFYYKHTTAMSKKTDVKIYMANTDLTSLSASSYVPYSEFTQVYSGSLNCTATDSWNEFILDTPFEYNGAGSLVVMIDDNSGQYDGSSYTFYYHAATGAEIYKRSDSDNENPSTTDWSTYTAANYRPSTKFCIQEADMVQYTVNWYVNGSIEHSQTGYEGATLTSIPTPTSSDCDGSKVFVGWYTSTYSHASTAPAYVSPTTIPNGGANYYAVFANRSGGGSPAFSRYQLVSSAPSDWSGKYLLSTGTYTATGALSSNAMVIASFTPGTTEQTSYEFTITKNGDNNNYYINNGTSYLVKKASDGTKLVLQANLTSVTDNYRWTLSTSQITNVGENTRYLGMNGTSDARAYSEAGHTALKLYKRIEESTYTYSNYATSCCTALGSINGSVSWSNAATAVVSWDNLDHVSSWTVKYKTHAAGAYTTWAGDQSTAAGRRSVTITGLTPCTNYDFQIIANPASGYCDKDQTIEDSQTHNWTVTKTGVTNVTAASLSAIPATTCASGFGPITITAATGYALPADITVTNASKSWNSSTGALSISSVTGNVSITITPTCVSPVVTADPEDADYYVGDAPTALSVTATLASGTRTYLWKVSTNGGSTWSDASGTNNAATYSGASLSTASAGTLKFKCIVGNSEGGCTVESEVATITVAEPSSWKFKYSGDSWEEHTMIEDAGVASYSISLDADSRFEFCFAGGSVYKNSGTMITTTSGWTFNTSDNNCKIHTGPAGTYTFAINTSTKSVTVTYPTVSHPNEHYVYFKNTNVWGTVYGYLANSENDNKAAAWPGSVMAATTTICGETYHYAALNAMSGTYNTIIFNNGNSGYGNQTSDLSTTGSLGKYNANSDAAWHQFKYAIRFDKGTGSGDAMSSIENLCPESDQALTANTYTKEHHTFAGWIADVDVKVGESTIDAGEIIDDEVTIKDIQSDINLTAQWTPNTYTITKTLTNVANVGLPASFTYTGATTTALNSTFTVDATNFFLPSSIAVTMGGTPLTAGTDYTYNNSTGAFTFSAVITGDIVITAAATAKLKSIAITTQPTTRKYFAGESFSSAGAVVTATMGDGSTKTVSETWDLTTLTAGAGQTVTASYSEGGIDQTATTTIDVYSVTVNKVNEDGDAISADGVTATWTVGTKTIVAGVGSTKYAFKQWEVTGATAASTTSASTTLSSPTANVVVNAVFYKPRVVKWSVNGDDSYATGGPTTEVAYNGTISTVPTDPSGLVCAGTFVAWTDAAHNNGTTAKDNASYYGSALYTAAGDFPNITAATTTFYAVFAEVPDEYYWSMGTIDQLTTGSGYATYDGEHTVKGSDGNNYTYTSQDVMSNSGNQFRGSSYCGRIYNTTSLGRITRIVLDYSAYAGQMKVYESDSEISSSGTTALTPSISDNRYTYNCSGKGYFIVIQEGSNAAKANVTVYFGDAPSNYVTECDANIVKVTYDANGGATSCTNTTTDKTEDFTVCSSAPTRDYYTFAGWLCSADSKTYAANATIDADAIDADFTLTAQWTPVPYDITYELDGGTNSGSNPATYNVTTATITLQNPTRDHDRFDGWYDNGSFTGDAVTSIPLGSHGDITLYAKWAERHEIIFDADGATTTIYRADDEDLSASVDDQGSVPSDPSAPTACSSKVFVGWSESTIDGETDTEPGDLMKPAAGTVDADKHYYAVWAIEESSSGTETIFTDDFNVTGADEVTSRSGWTDLSTVYGGSGSIRFSSGKNAGSMTLDVSGMEMSGTWEIKFKIKKYGTDDSGALAVSSAFEDVTTSFSPTSVSTTDGANWTEKTITVTGVHSGTEIHFDGTANSRVYVKDVEIKRTGTITTHSAYSTSCCATKIVLSDPSITDASTSGSTITFDKSSPVFTCDGTKTVTATLTLTAGYQASALSFAVNSGTVSISPAISTPITSSQVYTLTFAEDQNATLTTTATIAAKPLNGITITPSSGEVYVGQYADFTVSYDPADYLSPGYTLKATPVYVAKEAAAPANTKLRLKGGRASGPGASITETVNETVTIQASGDNTKTASVNITVNPLPRVHFEDLVHGKEFADVVATLSENALNPNKTTKTSVDWTTPNANTCEENHLHLVGWIREDWPALVAYLNGTGDAPTTTAIVGAGNDGSGNAYFFAPNASINVLTFNGATFYAVWAEIK